jgi:hypothetical protein
MHILLKTIKSFCMNNQLNISALLDEPVLLTQIVEELAACGSKERWGREIIHREWKTIGTASPEVYVSGKIALVTDDGTEVIYMPFESSFIFTCTQEKRGDFEMVWGASLS